MIFLCHFHVFLEWIKNGNQTYFLSFSKFITKHTLIFHENPFDHQKFWEMVENHFTIYVHKLKKYMGMHFLGTVLLRIFFSMDNILKGTNPKRNFKNDFLKRVWLEKMYELI